MLIEYVLNGKRKEVRPAVGKALIKVRAAREVAGDYLTRDMARQPVATKPMVAESAISTPTENAQADEDQATDGLDAMDKAQLHALAKERGLQLHHMLGADKVRAALRGESQE